MSLVLSELHKRYGDVRAVDGVGLELGERETVALLGPSGCGKSTLLRLVAGLETPDAGRVLLDGRDVTHTAPQRRRFGMVFQDYALFPHLDVEHNIAFGLVELGWERRARRDRTGELLELVGLAGFERRRVQQLSGGQQQRVALARALAPRPEVLLLDEPLSNLDPSLRATLEDELRTLLSSLAVRSLYVTHDQAEAFTVAPRVALMRAGRIVQQGDREELLERPGSAWVARFVGHRNVFEGGRPGGSGHGSAVLRADLVRVVPAGGAAAGAARGGDLAHGSAGGAIEAPAARVVEVRRTGLRWHLLLDVPAWGARVAWEGFPRELAGSPAAGDEVRLVVPDDAWWPLGAA